ncbi:hypothetical protein D5086_022311 [Populus alba]|uniref:Uncharacterized protein n=1 Tax=Populus alba TaxID=43335 RepID=A0ACC4BEN2_POPAL
MTTLLPMRLEFGKNRRSTHKVTVEAGQPNSYAEWPFGLTWVENKANKLDDWHGLADEDAWPSEIRKSMICEFRKQDYQRPYIYQKIGSQECTRQYGIKKNSSI